MLAVTTSCPSIGEAQLGLPFLLVARCVVSIDTLLFMRQRAAAERFTGLWRILKTSRDADPDYVWYS